MGRDIVGISDLRRDYPEKSEEDFQSLEKYLKIATKIVKHFANKMQSGLVKKILKDEDALANIAHKIMLGDWRWNPEYRSSNGRVRTRRSYLNQCGVWAIQEYIRRETTPARKQGSVSLDKLRDDFKWECRIDDDPLEILIREEEEHEEYFKLDEIIANSGLSVLEEVCVREYHLNPHFEDVGKSLGLSKKNAKNVYDTAIQKVIDNNVQVVEKDKQKED